MTPDAPRLVALALAGGVVAVDATSVGQFMLSRPLAAATLGGAIAGRPALGIMAGVVLEALHMAVLPVGAARYPEPGPPALAAGAVFAAAGHSYPALLVITLLALGWEWACGMSVLGIRQWNARFAGAGPDGISPGALARRQWTAIAADFARGAVLAVAGALLFGGVVDALGARIESFPAEWARIALALSVTAAAASALRLFGRGRYPLFLAGAALGAAVAWLR